MSTVYLFPGQGSQKVGMLSGLAHNDLVQSTFNEASEVLNIDLWEIAQTDAEGLINQTQITQPLLLTASIALWRVNQQQEGFTAPAYLAGHSLGEFSALVAAKALDFSDAVALVHQRGQFMQSAVEEGQGLMAAIIGLDSQGVVEVCQKAEQGQIVSAVNFNSPQQTVIAGEKPAVERACVLAKEAGAKRALPLPVSVPSHCALMQPAADQLAKTLANISLQTPVIPVIQNVSAQAFDQPQDIKQALVEQLYSPVQWVQTLAFFEAQGVSEYVECGPGNVLAGLGKRTVSGNWQNAEALIAKES